MTNQITIDPAALAAAQQVLMASWAGTRTKNVPSATPRATGYAHGNGGLLSAPGLSRDIINAMMLPHLGVQRLIPTHPSNEQFPLYAILTGQTAATGTFGGTDPHGVCEDPGTPGLLKLCEQSYTFGRQSIMTNVFELDRVGLTTNRGEYWDHQIIGAPFDNNAAGIPTAPGDSGISGALNNEITKQMFELANDWVRVFGRFLYTGNPVNNTGGGVQREYLGLDGLINTGYRDVRTSIACPRADSIVATFGSQDIKTAAGALNIYRTITSIDRRLRFRAVEMGLTPVRWVLAMRWSAFYELTEVWPCVNATSRCNGIGDASLQQITTHDGQIIQQQRADMRGNWDERTGQYLLIDGIKREVVIDDSITETALANGAFNSSIYWIPLTVRGGFQSTFMEYIDYDAANGAMSAARALAPDGFYFTTDGGRYLWHKKPPNNYCVQALVKGEPRLILRTPQIAARLTNVAYTPFQHEDDAFATPGYYFYDGGSPDFAGWGPSFWSITSR